MKKTILIVTALICSSLFTTACWEVDGPPPLDTSLAGSVALSRYGRYYIMEAEGVYGEIILKDIYRTSSLYTDKVSDTEISLECRTTWETEAFNISIPIIPLSGVAYDATFDHTSDAVSVKYNGKEYSSVNTTVKGWIKRVYTKSSNEIVSRDIAPLYYECEIDIACTIDGKALDIKVTSIDPDGGI